ncbi:MAG: hypothetical protein QOF94_2636 [Acidobacteriaceae bacterium]
MKILHATDRHTRAMSGIAFAVNEIIAQTSTQMDCDISLISAGNTDIALPPGTRHFHSKPGLRVSGPWRYAPGYARLCDRIVDEQEIDTLHIHGVWPHAVSAAHRVASRRGIPTVLTNHGQLTPWALGQPNRLGAIRKRFYLALMTDRLFQRVSVLHAITALDRESLHRLFSRNRIEVIPNSIDLAKLDGHAVKISKVSPAPYVLFVGRLHPVKGIDLLIEAFGRAVLSRDYRLIIAGPEEVRDYAVYLRKKIAASPRADQIELREPIWDPAEKYALMRSAWVTVVPSHSEVISLVNLESSACRTPTITTRATGLFDWEEGGGMLVEPTISAIERALSVSCNWPDEERSQRGQASRQLVERRYSTAATAPRWLELYNSLI